MKTYHCTRHGEIRKIKSMTSNYTLKPGILKLITEDKTDGFGLFEHPSGERNWIRMSLVEIQPQGLIEVEENVASK